MVDARGGAMRGCRHSGVRVIIPPGAAQQPTRITCRYLRRERLVHPPPLMEGEACASRIVEVGPSGARFLRPVVIEVPHFASLIGGQREVIILRSDNGELWREHSFEVDRRFVDSVVRAAEADEARENRENSHPQNIDNQSATNNVDSHGQKSTSQQQQQQRQLTRIVTNEFPQYFAIISRVRQDTHSVGPEGATLSSSAVPKVQAVLTEGALTKRIKIGLQTNDETNAATKEATARKRRSGLFACFRTTDGSVDLLDAPALRRQAAASDDDDDDEDDDRSSAGADSLEGPARTKRELRKDTRLVPEDYYLEKEPPLILNLQPATFGKRLAHAAAQTDKSANKKLSTRADKAKNGTASGGKRRKAQLTIHLSPTGAAADDKDGLLIKDAASKQRSCVVQTDSDSVTVAYVTSAAGGLGDDGYQSGCELVAKRRSAGREPAAAEVKITDKQLQKEAFKKQKLEKKQKAKKQKKVEFPAAEQDELDQRKSSDESKSLAQEESTSGAEVTEKRSSISLAVKTEDQRLVDEQPPIGLGTNELVREPRESAAAKDEELLISLASDSKVDGATLPIAAVSELAKELSDESVASASKATADSKAEKKEKAKEDKKRAKEEARRLKNEQKIAKEEEKKSKKLAEKNAAEAKKREKDAAKDAAKKAKQDLKKAKKEEEERKKEKSNKPVQQKLAKSASTSSSSSSSKKKDAEASIEELTATAITEESIKEAKARVEKLSAESSNAQLAESITQTLDDEQSAKQLARNNSRTESQLESHLPEPESSSSAKDAHMEAKKHKRTKKSKEAKQPKAVDESKLSDYDKKQKQQKEDNAQKHGFLSRLFGSKLSNSRKKLDNDESLSSSEQPAAKKKASRDEPLVVSEMYLENVDNPQGEMVLEVNVAKELVQSRPLKDDDDSARQQLNSLAGATTIDETLATYEADDDAKTLRDDSTVSESSPIASKPVHNASEVQEFVEEVIGEDGIVTKTTKKIETKYTTVREEEDVVTVEEGVPVNELDAHLRAADELLRKKQQGPRRSQSEQVALAKRQASEESQVLKPLLAEIAALLAIEEPSKKQRKRLHKLLKKQNKEDKKQAKVESKSAIKEAEVAKSQIRVCRAAADRATVSSSKCEKYAKQAAKNSKKVHNKMDKVDKRMTKTAIKLEKKQQKLDKLAEKREKELAKKEAKAAKEAEKASKKAGKAVAKLQRQESKRRSPSPAGKKSIKLEDIGEPVLCQTSRVSLTGEPSEAAVAAVVATASGMQQLRELRQQSQDRTDSVAEAASEAAIEAAQDIKRQKQHQAAMSDDEVEVNLDDQHIADQQLVSFTDQHQQQIGEEDEELASEAGKLAAEAQLAQIEFAEQQQQTRQSHGLRLDGALPAQAHQSQAQIPLRGDSFESSDVQLQSKASSSEPDYSQEDGFAEYSGKATEDVKASKKEEAQD